jgi:hypothetical protein
MSVLDSWMKRVKQLDTDRQAIYEILLRDDRLRCTCDESVREERFFQAQGHYTHCMLWQVSRAIEISLMYQNGYRLINGKLTKSSLCKEKKDE